MNVAARLLLAASTATATAVNFAAAVKVYSDAGCSHEISSANVFKMDTTIAQGFRGHCDEQQQAKYSCVYGADTMVRIERYMTPARGQPNAWQQQQLDKWQGQFASMAAHQSIASGNAPAPGQINQPANWGAQQPANWGVTPKVAPDADEEAQLVNSGWEDAWAQHPGQGQSPYGRRLEGDAPSVCVGQPKWGANLPIGQCVHDITGVYLKLVHLDGCDKIVSCADWRDPESGKFCDETGICGGVSLKGYAGSCSECTLDPGVEISCTGNERLMRQQAMTAMIVTPIALLSCCGLCLFIMFKKKMFCFNRIKKIKEAAEGEISNIELRDSRISRNEADTAVLVRAQSESDYGA